MLDFDEIIELQNSKSKEILDEYERIADEKREKYKREEDQLIGLNKLLEIEISKYKKYYLEISNSTSLTYKDIYIEMSEIDEKIDKLNKEIEKNNTNIECIRSRDIYPHGNGIFGFALAYYDISKKINVEWKESIFTYTILGYKRIYPEDAINYIQYEKDIKTSKILMKKIQDNLMLNNINYRELFWYDWLNHIRDYIQKNNIILDNDVVFRPIVHNTMMMDNDKLEYYCITKNDLEKKDDESDEDEIDMIDIIDNYFNI